MKNLLLLLVSAGLFLCASAVCSQEEDRNKQARELYKHGIKLYEQGEHKTAAEAFREAYRLRPSYKILFNIGQAEASSGRYGLAMEAFQQYLVDGKDAVPTERKDYVIGEIARMQQLVGELEVEAPENSSVYVDGVMRGMTPLTGPVIVVAGTDHDVVVVHNNQQLLKEKFKVWAGRTHTIEAEAIPEKKITPAPEPMPEPEEKTAEQEKEEEPQEQVPEDEGLDQTYFWIGVGTTAAFGAVALSCNFVARDKNEEYKKNPSKDLFNEVENIQNVGITFLALTGAALVTTGILAIFTDFSMGSEDEEGAEVSRNIIIAPWMAQGSGGIRMITGW